MNKALNNAKSNCAEVFRVLAVDAGTWREEVATGNFIATGLMSSGLILTARVTPDAVYKVTLNSPSDGSVYTPLLEGSCYSYGVPSHLEKVTSIGSDTSYSDDDLAKSAPGDGFLPGDSGFAVGYSSSLESGSTSGLVPVAAQITTNYIRQD